MHCGADQAPVSKGLVLLTGTASAASFVFNAHGRLGLDLNAIVKQGQVCACVHMGAQIQFARC